MWICFCQRTWQWVTVYDYHCVIWVLLLNCFDLIFLPGEICFWMEFHVWYGGTKHRGLVSVGCLSGPRYRGWFSAGILVVQMTASCDF